MALTKFNYNSFDITPVASKALAFNSDADGLTTAAEASMVLIKTLTSDGSDANLSFVNGSSDVVLDSTYPIYKFVFTSIHGETDNKNLTFNMSIDTGSNYNVTKTSSAFLSYHNEAGNDAGVQYAAAEDLAQSTAVQNISGLVGTDNDASTSGELFLYSPSSTTFVKHFISQSSTYRSDIQMNYNWFAAGYGNTTSAVDAIQFKFASGNIDSGTIKLYGIKDS